MRENATKAKWRRGEVTYGAWLWIPSSFSAEIVAHAEFASGIPGPAARRHRLPGGCRDAAGAQHGRLHAHRPRAVERAGDHRQDAGRRRDGRHRADGEHADEARAAVAACRYAPVGARSYAPTRAAMYAGADYCGAANDEVACIPVIETKRALDGLDAILDVPGIDAVYVGPADMSIALGQQPRMDNEGAFEEARIRIAAACAKHGVTPPASTATRRSPRSTPPPATA